VIYLYVIYKAISRQNIMESKIRSEAEIFDELKKICSLSGYIHVIAYFCHRDSYISYHDKINTENLLQQTSEKQLIRNEISTLIGLLIKSKITYELPAPKIFQSYIDKTEKLLEELHIAVGAIYDSCNFEINGATLREVIFYEGEAAYDFQYQDLSLKKYQNDNDWFISKKRFSIQAASSIISAIYKVQQSKIVKYFKEIDLSNLNKLTILPAFIVTSAEVSLESGEDILIVQAFLSSFTSSCKMISEANFSSLDDFNPANAYPIIKKNTDEFILLQPYRLVEAWYETPFFWFMEDSNYKEIANKNRGDFTEKFSEERLKLVFGKNRVFTNINIYEKQGKCVGEIDVLVLFGNRAIILQAKSKKLTIQARKGNDNCLKSDFKKAVQDAYNQAYECATYLNNRKYKFYDNQGNELKILPKYKEIYPLCVISDHYPSLNIQVHSFLQYEKTNYIMPPYVIDIFFLDTLSEMLQSPLYFLSFLNRRIKYNTQILAHHELAILSFHLQHNLWITNGNQIVSLLDDICVDLDLAMMVRRTGITDIKIPQNILTFYEGTYFKKLVDEINLRNDSDSIELGFFLLELGSPSVESLNKNIPKLIKATIADGHCHDLTLLGKQVGLTIHCSKECTPDLISILKEHCLQKKYTKKAKKWFGAFISPTGEFIQYITNFDFDWVYSSEIEKKVKKVKIFSELKKKPKLGRNDPCPCGSGKKYKKCHYNI